MPNIRLNVLDRSGHTIITDPVEVKEQAREAVREKGMMLFAEYVNSLGEPVKEHLLDVDEVDTLEYTPSNTEQPDVNLYLAGPFAGG